MTNQKTTIKDIALAAGVSTQTISRVLNNRPDVSSETRKRVLQTIANLNYSPNAFARRMRKNNTQLDDVPASVILKDALAATPTELRDVIDMELRNGTLSHEKAIWLREGLEKKFITDECYVHVPIVEYETIAEVAAILALLAVK